MQVEGPDQVTRAHACGDPRLYAFERLTGGAASAAARAQMSQSKGQELCARQSSTRRTPEQSQQQHQQQQRSADGERARPTGQLAAEDTSHGREKVGIPTPAWKRQRATLAVKQEGQQTPLSILQRIQARGTQVPPAAANPGQGMPAQAEQRAGIPGEPPRQPLARIGWNSGRALERMQNPSRPEKCSGASARAAG